MGERESQIDFAGQAFDHVFLLRSAMVRFHLSPSVTVHGHKLLKIGLCKTLTALDSFAFVSQSLRNFSKAMGVEVGGRIDIAFLSAKQTQFQCSKLWFPLDLLRPALLGQVVPFPSREEFTVTVSEDFERFYVAEKARHNGLFDVSARMEEYCYMVCCRFVV